MPKALFLILMTIISNGQAGTLLQPSSNNGWSIITDGGTVLAKGATLGEITQTCQHRVCTQTCTGGRCFDRLYQSFMIYEGCPNAACEFGCGDLVFGPDDCPICPCEGFSTREPCTSKSDCQSPNGRCEKNLCRYSAVAADLPKECTLSGMYKKRRPGDPTFGRKAQCARPNNANQPAAQSGSAGAACKSDGQCPLGHTCQAGNCAENQKRKIARKLFS